MAIDEINIAGGVNGRPVAVNIVDAGRDPETIASEADKLIKEGAIDAVVGAHTSAVRLALIRAIRQRVPYIYTPLYEGGEKAFGVFPIGETPNQQVRPAVRWFHREFGVRRWALIGNDYIWPHVSHKAARRYIAAAGGTVVGEDFVPLGCEDFTAAIDGIAALRPDAVMASLIGQDLVHFNRQFAMRDLDRTMKRFCPALEENILLGLIPTIGRDLYTSGAYFASLKSSANQDFRALYFGRFTSAAPVLNRFSALCYEGIRLFADMVRAAGTTHVSSLSAIAEGFTLEGPRGRLRLSGNHVNTPIYMARADGNILETIHRFPDQKPGV